MKRFFNKFSAFNALIWTAIVTLIAFTATALWILFGPVEVLRNWQMSVGGTDKVFETSSVTYFSSTSEKLINTEGRADRYLICDATANAPESEIGISNVPLNRPAGFNPLRQNAFDMPGAEVFTELPRKCKLHINACYTVYGFRKVCYQAETEKFTVVENNGNDSDDNQDTNAESNDNLNTGVYPSFYYTQPNTDNQTPSTPTMPTTPTNPSTGNGVENENTIVTACAVDADVLGLIPIKLFCSERE